jgi:hypothetical protein
MLSLAQDAVGIHRGAVIHQDLVLSGGNWKEVLRREEGGAAGQQLRKCQGLQRTGLSRLGSEARGITRPFRATGRQ